MKLKNQGVGQSGSEVTSALGGQKDSKSVSLFSCSITKSRSPLSTPRTAAHYLLELAQAHLHWVGDAIRPSHPLSSPALLPSVFPSIRVFSNESALHIRWSKYWSFSFSISPSNEYSGLISFRTDQLDLLAVQGTLKNLGVCKSMFMLSLLLTLNIYYRSLSQGELDRPEMYYWIHFTDEKTEVEEFTALGGIPPTLSPNQSQCSFLTVLPQLRDTWDHKLREEHPGGWRTVKWKSFSCMWFFETPGTVAHQAPLSMGFSRQEYWSRWSFPSPKDLPDPGTEPRSPAS